MLAFFTMGLLSGGVLSALVLWLLSGLSEPIPEPVRWVLIAGVAVTGLLREIGVVRLPLPQNARQIPADVLQHQPRLGPLRFGFELGTGVRTYVSSSAPYVVALALVLSHPGLVTAAATGLGFGLGRAATAAVHLWSRDPEWNDRAASRMGWISGITMTALLAMVVLLALALPWSRWIPDS